MNPNTIKTAILLCAAGSVLATAQPALEWTGSQTHVFEGGMIMRGWRFRVSSASDIEVWALGAYDHYGDGLPSPYTVSIWPASGGEPLTTAVVPAGIEGHIEGHFRYVNITNATPVRLLKDAEYVIGSCGHDEAVAWAPEGLANAPGIIWLESRKVDGCAFPTYPGTPDVVGYLGPNFQFNPVPSVRRFIAAVDQEQTGTGCMNNSGGQGLAARKAQTFTPTFAGLDAVELMLAGSVAGDAYYVNIRETNLLGQVVGTSSVTTLTTTEHLAYVLLEFSFSSIVPLTPGKTYAIELVPVALPGGGFTVRTSCSDVYAGGEYFATEHIQAGTDAWFREGLQRDPVSFVVCGVRWNSMQAENRIPYELREKVDRELESGEHIQWLQMPVPRYFTPAATAGFLFGIPWTAFAVFWTAGAAWGTSKAEVRVSPGLSRSLACRLF